MKKILLLLCALLGTIGAKADVITSASQLSNTKVYTIRTTRGYMTLNTAQTMIVSSHKSDGGTVNDAAATDDESKYFGIINYDGKYFLYSPKLNKFARLVGQNLYMNYTDRGIALDITTDGSGNPDGSKLRFFAHGIGSEGYSKWCLNNNNSGNLVLNGYTGAEAGNTVSIEEVNGETLDIDAAMEVFNGAPQFYDMHKVYNITNKRITNWTANSGNTGLTGTSTYSGSAEEQQFAFFKYNGKQYLYNVAAKKFVATDGSLTANKGDAATIAVWYTDDGSYPYCFYIEERGLLFNAQGGGGFAINAWNSSFDDGNKHNLVEVEDVDVYDEILAFFEIPSWDVTYNIYFNGNKIGEEIRNQDKDSQAALSSAWNNQFVSLNYSPTTIATGVTSVDVTVTWDGPIDIYNDYASIEWKNLYLDRSDASNESNKGNYYLYNSGNAPTYLIKDPTDKQRAGDAFQWGFVGNPYQLKIYNKQSGSAQTLHPSGTITMADGDSYWSIKYKNTVNDVDGFLIGKTNETNFINEAGGAGNLGLGYWGSTNDRGSTYFVAEVPEIPVTNVYFDLTYNGQVAHTVVVSGLEVGDDVPAMPAVTAPAYTSFDAPNVEGMTVTENLHIIVPVTWDGPFELSADYASAHWYDMAIRSTWYVTSDNKDASGALQTVNANALGLGDDAYHWAFVGDPWHIQVVNKAEGSTKNFGYPTQANQGVPSFEADTYYWTIKESTSGIANSFVMNVGGTNLYINQYGGAGGSLKFWDSGNNISDAGSAFTVFDIPTDYSTYVAAEISPAMESTAKYFVLKPAVAATVGYDADYKNSCTFEQYKTMKLAYMAIDMTDLNNFVLPETGNYRLKNKYYGKYMGLKASTVYGNYSDDADVNSPVTIVKLRKEDNTYSIKLQEKYLQAATQSQNVPFNDDVESMFTPTIPAVGNAAFAVDPSAQFSYLHCAGGGNVVGWEAPADASQWVLEDATSFNVTISAAKYATFCVPFAVTIPTGVTAWAVSEIGDRGHLILTEITTTIPEGLPVILQGEAGTYTFNITTGGSYEGINLLRGNYTESSVECDNNNYVLQKQEGEEEAGFYRVEDENKTIKANRAYLHVDGAGVKAFFFGGETAIKSVFDGVAAGDIYDLNGVKAEKMQKGKAYIVNGTTVIVK